MSLPPCNFDFPLSILTDDTLKREDLIRMAAKNLLNKMTYQQIQEHLELHYAGMVTKEGKTYIRYHTMAYFKENNEK